MTNGEWYIPESHLGHSCFARRAVALAKAGHSARRGGRLDFHHFGFFVPKLFVNRVNEAVGELLDVSFQIVQPVFG